MSGEEFIFGFALGAIGVPILMSLGEFREDGSLKVKSKPKKVYFRDYHGRFASSLALVAKPRPKRFKVAKHAKKKK